tara:strand:+ start:73 stop:291 length:219 start_codon:yes stop_codon:yes gene_type:complete
MIYKEEVFKSKETAKELSLRHQKVIEKGTSMISEDRKTTVLAKDKNVQKYLELGFKRVVKNSSTEADKFITK